MADIPMEQLVENCDSLEEVFQNAKAFGVKLHVTNLNLCNLLTILEANKDYAVVIQEQSSKYSEAIGTNTNKPLIHPYGSSVVYEIQ